MSRRLLVTLAGVLFFAAVLAPMLLTPVSASRGRNELDFATLHEVPLSPILTQPILLQGPDPYAIDLPYRWFGQRPARLKVDLIGSDGQTISERVDALPDTRAPRWLVPIVDGSVWQTEQAAFHVISLPPGISRTIILRLTRVDVEPGTLVLFASDHVPALASGRPAFQLDTRPTLAERSSEVLEFQTEYGKPQPAITKAGAYLTRLQSLAPRWLPSPLPLLLFLVVVVSAFLLAWMAPDEPVRDPTEPPSTI